MTTFGTCHFVSRQQAIRYYRSQGYVDAAAAVDEKVKEQAIVIGPPKTKPGQTLSVNDEGRYVVKESPLKERLEKLYRKGYRFCIEFEDNKIEPLAVKTLSEIGPLMRTNYKDEKNWQAWEFDVDGNKTTKWKQTTNPDFFEA